MKDKMYLKLYDFKNLSMDEQGSFTNDLVYVLERVASGVWCQHDAGFYSYSQCAFCCVSPESKHDDNCPVKLAKEILENVD